MNYRNPVVETGRYVQKRRGHYTMGCPRVYKRKTLVKQHLPGTQRRAASLQEE